MSSPFIERIGVEIVAPDGRVVRSERLSLTEGQRLLVGRGLQCDIWLNDAYCAGEHAELFLDSEAALWVKDLGSQNGTWVNDIKLGSGESARIENGRLRIGQSQLVLLRTVEAIAPERLLPVADVAHEGAPGQGLRQNPTASPSSLGYGSSPTREESTRPRWHLENWLQRSASWWIRLATLLGLFAAAGLAFQVWQGAERDAVSGWATRLVGASLLAAMWVFFWALLTRLMKGEWRWAPHAAVFLATSLCGIVLHFVAEVLRFSFALPPLSSAVLVLVGGLAALALYLHLRIASPMGATRAWLIGLAIPLLGLGGSQWLDARAGGRSVNRIDSVERLFPPSFRLRHGEPVGEFFKSLALESEATSKAKIGQNDDDDDEGVDFSD